MFLFGMAKPFCHFYQTHKQTSKQTIKLILQKQHGKVSAYELCCLKNMCMRFLISPFSDHKWFLPS